MPLCRIGSSVPRPAAFECILSEKPRGVRFSASHHSFFHRLSAAARHCRASMRRHGRALDPYEVFGYRAASANSSVWRSKPSIPEHEGKTMPAKKTKLGNDWISYYVGQEESNDITTYLLAHGVYAR